MRGSRAPVARAILRAVGRFPVNCSSPVQAYPYILISIGVQKATRTATMDRRAFLTSLAAIAGGAVALVLTAPNAEAMIQAAPLPAPVPSEAPQPAVLDGEDMADAKVEEARWVWVRRRRRVRFRRRRRRWWFRVHRRRWRVRRRRHVWFRRRRHWHFRHYRRFF